VYLQNNKKSTAANLDQHLFPSRIRSREAAGESDSSCGVVEREAQKNKRSCVYSRTDPGNSFARGAGSTARLFTRFLGCSGRRSKVTLTPRALFAYHSLLRTFTQHTGSWFHRWRREPSTGLLHVETRMSCHSCRAAAEQISEKRLFLVKLRFSMSDIMPTWHFPSQEQIACS
jgi:hypothetical protein